MIKNTVWPSTMWLFCCFICSFFFQVFSTFLISLSPMKSRKTKSTKSHVHRVHQTFDSIHIHSTIASSHQDRSPCNDPHKTSLKNSSPTPYQQPSHFLFPEPTKSLNFVVYFPRFYELRNKLAESGDEHIECKPHETCTFDFEIFLRTILLVTGRWILLPWKSTRILSWAVMMGICGFLGRLNRSCQKCLGLRSRPM